MIQYPIRFFAESQMFGPSDALMTAPWECHSSQRVLSVSVPSEFEGSGAALSPEDLFHQALAQCFVATFRVYCHHSKLSFERLAIQSELVVDRDQNKLPVMKSFKAHVKIAGASNVERIKLLAEKAARSGFILNSVKTERAFEFEIT